MVHIVLGVPPIVGKAIDKGRKYLTKVIESFTTAMGHRMTYPGSNKLTQRKTKNAEPPGICEASSQKYEGNRDNKYGLDPPFWFI